MASLTRRSTTSPSPELLRYLDNLATLKKQRETAQAKFPFGIPRPFFDWDSDSGSVGGHYFYQDLYVAQRIFQVSPRRHIDVGSRLDGFVAHVASFRPIEVIDIRPQKQKFPNMTFIQHDMMDTLPPELTECTDSLSCLHALEHFGLGRYGDRIDYDGYLVGLDNLYRMLEPDGRLYISVPIGIQRIEFNAHRIFSPVFFAHLLRSLFDIVHISIVDIAGLRENMRWAEICNVVLGSSRCGCGIFELKKRGQ